ncbi:amidohydrolase [Mariprofundus ferrinatatus]|uniref:Amidohydrolase n=1 Tax=Mariprofundus ferrinatatus TaxID=1921087 RepID=A0A2K8LAR4_9PROT|nr:amidohydrolase [Mariprofundus ferrinatatus]ATX82034.1 amidohydrolase [Mariprofundus ferrinatatus]
MRVDNNILATTVDRMIPEIIRIRRHIHEHPELSGAEEKTALLVAGECRKLGLEVRENIGGFGVLATLCIDPAKSWIAFRADMDALPIRDGKQLPYASHFEGISHSCGHDVHTAVLLGAAKVICSHKETLNHNIAFVFQPAEETCEGAAAMLREHLFESTGQPEQIYAMHVFPYLPAGSVGMRQGPMCAAADMFDVEIQGRGGHAARPHECIDVILIASHVIQALHHIVSRRVNPLHPAVLTIGQIQGGYAGNVIPDRVGFSGTIRSLHPESHEEIRALMDRIIRQTCEAWGATARFTLKQATPVLTNDSKLLSQAAEIISESFPDIAQVDLPEPSLGGEDFAEFMREIPGCLFRLGTGGGPETRYPLHHPNFDIDESSMRSGIAAFAALALNQ